VKERPSWDMSKKYNCVGDVFRNDRFVQIFTMLLIIWGVVLFVLIVGGDK